MRKFLLTCLLFIFVSQSKATNHIITSSGDDSDNPTLGMLRYAIENASNGDTITFDVSTVSLDTALRINGGVLTIDGESGVIIDGNNMDRIFNISCYSSSDNITIKNISIQNGKVEDASAMGGGMYAYILSGNLLVENCTFKNNTVVSNADGQGGALRTYGGTFRNCFFLNNEVSGTASALGGGGIFSIGGTFINCVIAGNSAKYGGGVYSSTSSEFINTTITQNNATNADAGGGVSCEDNCTFTNNIIYKNQSNGAENNINNYLNTSTFSFCAVEDGNAMVGTNNNIGLSSTPFTHTGEDSLSIYKGSVCENAGTTSGITVLSEDIIGNDRVYNGNVDIGAYEFISPLIVTRTDDNLNNPKIGMLRYAIENADHGDTITFEVDSIMADTTFTFGTKSLSIIGKNSNNVGIIGDYSFTLFYIHTKDDTISTELKNLNFKRGGGRYAALCGLFNHKAVVENCNFTDNIGTHYGGAYVRYGKVSNCNFTNNKIIGANYGVGGLFASSTKIINCDFINNGSHNDQSFIRYGGLDATECEITNCRIINNYSNSIEGAGGAHVQNCELTDCYFYKNYVKREVEAFAGGALSYNSSFVNCIFKENIGADFYGGMAVPEYAGGVSAEGGTFINCLFDGNKGNCVGGLYSGSSFESYVDMNIINCTFTRNTAKIEESGGFHLFGNYFNWNGAITTVKNTVSYGNYPNNYSSLNDSVDLTYCAIRDTLIDGEGNIKLNESPFEYSNTEDHYFLKENSLCIDTGDTTGISNMLILTDLIGNNRINNDIVDIGAIEYKQRKVPLINWPTTNEIQYGDSLYKAIKNDGSADISGYFVYDSLSVLDAGKQKVEIVFSPIIDSIYNYKSLGDTLVITVNKESLTVIAKDTTIEYGAEEPKYRLKYSGFILNEDSTVIDNKPSVEVSNYQSLNADIYDEAIVVSGANDNNYKFLYQNGTLKINKTDLKVTVQDTTIVYGDTEPIYKLKYEGFVKEENLDVIDTKPISYVHQFESLGAGVYYDSIQVTGGIDNNYKFIYQNATLTIGKTLLNVTAQDTTVKLGDTEPNYRLVYNGFVNDEDINVIDILPVVSVENYVSLSTGVYNDIIIVSDGEDNNYKFNYYPGTLTIEQSTSIFEALKNEIAVYPNPAPGNINFKLPDNTSEFKLLIVDNNGRTLFNNPNYNKQHFDLSSYPPGNYLFIIEYSNKMFSFPVIKQ